MKRSDETQLGFDLNKLRVRITFREPLLGTQPADPELHEKFIASKAPDAKSMAEEIAEKGAEEVTEKSMTVFPREDGAPFLWDYQIKGFFKEACSMLKRAKIKPSSDMTAFKKVIDGLIFVSPRRIPIKFRGDIGNNQRPLRASTPQGERVALANSEEIPAGATAEFTVEMLDPAYREAVVAWLRYGAMHGLGQWRNASYGRFTTEIIEG